VVIDGEKKFPDLALEIALTTAASASSRYTVDFNVRRSGSGAGRRWNLRATRRRRRLRSGLAESAASGPRHRAARALRGDPFMQQAVARSRRLRRQPLIRDAAGWRPRGCGRHKSSLVESVQLSPPHNRLFELGKSKKVGSFLISSIPAPEKAKDSPGFPFWRCTTVEPTTDRRERNSDELCIGNRSKPGFVRVAGLRQIRFWRSNRADS